MKEKYDRAEFTVTQFEEEDVITTSGFDRHNAYNSYSGLNKDNVREAPTSW